DLEEFRANGDGTFAEAVGQVAGSHGKQNERCGEEDADFELKVVSGTLVLDDSENHVDDEKLEPVVVEGALELRDDQAPKAEPPRASGLRRVNTGAGAGVSRHAAPPEYLESRDEVRTILAAKLAKAREALAPL